MTQCIAAPGPDDLALVAYNEGDGDSATIEHLRHCSYCRERAELLAKHEERLSALLHRITCPSTEELRDYHFNFLPAAQITAITTHVQSCPHCTRELTTLVRFLESDTEEIFGLQPTQTDQALGQNEALGQDVTQSDITQSGVAQSNVVQSGVVQRIRTILATWLQGGQGGMAPALAGLRGEDNSHQFYLAGELQIGIDIQRDPKQANRRELLGTVLGLDLAALMDSSTPRSTWQAHLWRKEQLVASVPVQELGSFVFANLVPTEYELNITGPNIAINIMSLTVA
jgi:hypothetical protein